MIKTVLFKWFVFFPSCYWWWFSYSSFIYFASYLTSKENRRKERRKKKNHLIHNKLHHWRWNMLKLSSEHTNWRKTHSPECLTTEKLLYQIVFGMFMFIEIWYILKLYTQYMWKSWNALCEMKNGPNYFKSKQLFCHTWKYFM